MNTPSNALILLAIGLCFVGGCTGGREYAVVEPSTARSVIPPNAGPMTERDKIAYEIFQQQEKVIVRYINRTGGPLTVSQESVIIDAAGRQYGVDAQDLAPEQPGRVVLPPSVAVEKGRVAPVMTPVRIGGVDEGGLIGTRRDVESNAAGVNAGATAAPSAGFRWGVGDRAKLRLIFTTPDDKTITHQWIIRRAK